MVDFGVSLSGLESFEGFRDCFGAGWDKVEVEAAEVSGAVGGFLEYHPFTAGSEKLAAVAVFAEKISGGDRTSMAARPGPDGNRLVPLGEFGEFYLDV